MGHPPVVRFAPAEVLKRHTRHSEVLSFEHRLSFKSNHPKATTTALGHSATKTLQQHRLTSTVRHWKRYKELAHHKRSTKPTQQDYLVLWPIA